MSPLSPTPNSVEVNDILYISIAGDGPVELTFRGREGGKTANLSMELTPPYISGQDGVLRMPKIRKTKTLLLQWYNEDQGREIKAKRQYQHSIIDKEILNKYEWPLHIEIKD